MANYNNIMRIIHRCAEELDATRKVAKVISVKEGLETLRAKVDIHIMNHNGYYENRIRKTHLMRKHDIMLRYYEKMFGDFLKTYDFNHNDMQFPISEYSDCVWVCWWQGVEHAPKLVRTCVDSIIRNAGKHRVIVLTENNYRQYVNIPTWVEDKKNRGIISNTHYSDILRMSLLAQHGGMWLDSTFFCTTPELQNYFELPLWSIKRPGYAHASIASGYFANYSFACTSDNRWVFKTILDFLLEYWVRNDTLTDYLFLDYLIVLVQKYDTKIAEMFKKIPTNNPECDELFKVLGEKFDNHKWDNIKRETSLFKLSWKYRYHEEKEGTPTFYGMLFNNKMC